MNQRWRALEGGIEFIGTGPGIWWPQPWYDMYRAEYKKARTAHGRLMEE